MTDSDSRTILFLGFALPEGEFEAVLASDSGMPTQTQRFGWAVIDALGAAGMRVHAVSAAPATDFPHNSRLYFRGYEFTEHSVTGSVIPFVNLIGLKHITRYVAGARLVRRAFRTLAPSAILVHGVHSPFIWIGLKIARRWGVPSVVILTDPPSLTTPSDSLLGIMMKTLDRQIILRGLRSVTGVIALTEGLVTDFAPGVPYLHMEGIARPLGSGASNARVATSAPARVLYAGGLHEDYGVCALLDAVSLSTRDWELWIYGRGPMEAQVRARAALEPRIRYGGFANAQELTEAYSRADLLVNPRPVNAPFVRHSFPSKLLEYMVSARPVLSTRLAQVPADYEPYVFWSGDTAQELATSIDAILATETQVLAAKGLAGREFALAAKGRTAQGTRMRDFLQSLEQAAAHRRR